MSTSRRLVDDPNTPTALYRYFDERDRLLYIGITGDLANREQGHIRASLWTQLVASSTVSRYPKRRAALLAERKAIGAERPLFNKQYNNTPEARRRLKAYLEEIRRTDMLGPKRSLNMPPGELEYKDPIRVLRAVDQSQACPEDSGGEHKTRISVEHALDANGQPVCPKGMVILHMFDGTRCTEVYLYASETLELAERLTSHAADALTSAPGAREPTLELLR